MEPQNTPAWIELNSFTLSFVKCFLFFSLGASTTVSGTLSNSVATTCIKTSSKYFNDIRYRHKYSSLNYEVDMNYELLHYLLLYMLFINIYIIITWMFFPLLIVYVLLVGLCQYTMVYVQSIHLFNPSSLVRSSFVGFLVDYLTVWWFNVKYQCITNLK